MQGVVLAAGKGSRLHPLTLDRSKAMLPVAGKPMVERVMSLLVENGIDDLILVVSPEDREIARYFGRGSRLEADVRFVYQIERKGMAHALSYAAPLIDEPFVLSACDNLVSVDAVGRLIALMSGEPRPNGVLTLMTVEPEKLRTGASVEMQGGWVTRIVEKPRPEEAPSNVASLPLYAFSPRILDLLPAVPVSSRGEYELQDAIQMLIDSEGRVGGILVDWRKTVTKAADLIALNRETLMQDADASRVTPHAVGHATALVTPLHIGPNTTIGSHCTVGPNVTIEGDCRIGDGVTLRDAVLLRGATVASGCEVANEVVAASL